MEYSVENIKKAVDIFYRTDEQAGAHQWLTEAQNSPEAWNFVWELLNQNESHEVQFFAATTLHNKVLKHWHEISKNAECCEALKGQIMRNIVAYAKGPKLILNRLCIALSAFIVHTISNEWPTALEDLVVSFQPSNLQGVEPDRILWILLEILMVIPEEFHTAPLSKTKKVSIVSILYTKTEQVLKFIMTYCLPRMDGINPIGVSPFCESNLMAYCNGIKCINSWILISNMTICDCSNVIDTLVQLAQYVYWQKLVDEEDDLGLEGFELFETTLDSLNGFMHLNNNFKHPSLLLKHMGNFCQNFDRILERELSKGEDMNHDIISVIYTLYVTSADTHAKTVVQGLSSTNPQDVRVCSTMINHMLQCNNMPGNYPVDETCSNLTFTFWFALQDEVFNGDDNSANDPVKNMLRTFYQQLIPILLKKSAYPHDYDDGNVKQWSLDDRELFRCYRQDIADTYSYCMCVLENNMLIQLISELCNARNLYLSDPSKNWSILESCLHALAAVAEHDCLVDAYVHQLMVIIHDLTLRNDLNKRVFETVLELLGEYSEWMNDNPTVLHFVIPVIMKAVEIVDLAPISTLSLKDVARNCQEHLQPFAEQILWFCQNSLFREGFKQAERYRIAQIFGTTITTSTPERIALGLKTVWEPMVLEIKFILDLPITREGTSSLVTRIKMLSNLFMNMTFSEQEEQLQEPVLIFVQNAFPLLEKIGNDYFSNVEVVGALCGLFRNIIICLREKSQSLILGILVLLSHMYSHYPQENILHLSKVLLTNIQNEEETLRKHKLKFLANIISKTLHLTSEMISMDSLSEICDLLEAFFILIHSFSKNTRHKRFPEIDEASLFQCSIACLAMPEQLVLKAISCYLTAFVMASRENGLEDVIRACGETLVDRLFLNFAGMSPKNTIDYQADILFALNRLYGQELAQWLHRQIGQEGYPSPHITSQQKMQYISIFLKNKVNKQKLSASVMEYSLLCRGIVNCEGRV